MRQAVKLNKNRKRYVLSIFIILSIGTICFSLKNVFRKDDQPIDSTLLSNREAYFIPLKISGYASGDIPYLEVIIEDKPVMVDLDLGYTGMLSLPSNVIEEINKKKFINRSRSYGITGKTYENDVYKVEEIKIEDITFFPVKVEERSLEFYQDGLLIGNKEQSQYKFGAIGWELFYNFNLLVDCKHSTLALCDSLETLKQHEYPVSFFAEVPFLSNFGLIEFEALTELGMLHCMLDTGATWNMLNKDLRNECNDHRIFKDKKGDQSFLNPENKDLLIFNPDDTQKFSNFNMGGKDFGPITFDCMKSPFPIDAILGMEFFHSTLVFIDFANRKLYFYAYPLEDEISTNQSIAKTDAFLFLTLLSPHSQFSLYKAPLACSNRFQSPAEGMFFRWRALTNHRPQI